MRIQFGMKLSKFFKSIQRSIGWFCLDQEQWGIFKFNSDIDLVLFSNEISFRRFLDLSADLSDLGLLYRIDLIDFNRITNEELKSHIERVGLIIYNSSIRRNKKGLQKLI